MKVKFNEIGRSMLEMLGVLAVTGVLSVGGIMEITAPFVVLKVIRQKTNLCKAYLESAIFVMNLKVSI